MKKNMKDLCDQFGIDSEVVYDVSVLNMKLYEC